MPDNDKKYDSLKPHADPWVWRCNSAQRRLQQGRVYRDEMSTIKGEAPCTEI